MSEAVLNSSNSLSPMLKMYCDYKLQYPDCLLLMQVGDFYESFFDDAVQLAKILNLTLTSRDKNSADPIPMAGIPVSVLDAYMERAVEAGSSIAVVSQAGSGKQVERYLDRIVTPGVRLLGTANREEKAEIFVAGVVPNHAEADLMTQVSLVLLNAQAGSLAVHDFQNMTSLMQYLQLSACSEIILPAEISQVNLDKRYKWIRDLDSLATVKFRANRSSYRTLSEITGYSSLLPECQKAVKLIVNYLDEITVSRKVELKILEQGNEKILSIDSRTRRNLELVANLKDGSINGTVLEWLDCTSSCIGARCLRSLLLKPSADLVEIKARQVAVSELLVESYDRQELRKSLKLVPDLERIASRIQLKVVSPKELAAVRFCLTNLPLIKEKLKSSKAKLLQDLVADLDYNPEIQQLLESILAAEPAISLKEGGVIKFGVNPDLDRLRTLKNDAVSLISAMEISERERSGISSLKIKYNNLHGYFIEVTKANLAKVPDNYIRKQSTVNSDKFVTAELREIESELLSADDKAIAIEKKIYEQLVNDLLPHIEELRRLSARLAILDVLLAFAELAERENLCQPELDESLDFKIIAAKHPVVASYLGSRFIPNDLDLSKNPGVILTGANMGGKSTFLRQNAILVILAQIGSYVPATSAIFGIVDRVFARIGASDDLHEGDSTFMLEMRETSYILNLASTRSLVVIDELGRGTATQDGLAIANAVLEDLNQRLKCRFLFATHYYELTKLNLTMSGISNLSVESLDQDGEFVFSHRIIEGPASRSYGIQVAKLAGLPEAVLERAQSLLTEYAEKPKGKQQLQLISTTNNETELKELRKLQERIRKLDCESINSKQALDFLFDVKKDFKL